jgi:hypothetical protein
LTGDSQAPDFAIREEFASVVAIAHRTKGAFGSIDEISAHSSPPEITGGKMRKKETDFWNKSVIWAAKRSNNPPTQLCVVFIFNLQLFRLLLAILLEIGQLKLRLVK